MPDIEIPDWMPRRVVPGTGNMPWGDEDRSIFNAYLRFAQTEFALTYLWAQVEKRRLQDRYLGPPRPPSAFFRETEPVAPVPGHPPYLENFQTVARGELTPETYLASEGTHPYVLRLWVMHYLSTTRLMAENILDDPAHVARGYLGSREELFWFFVLEPHREPSRHSFLSHMGEDEVRAELTPNWEQSL